MTHCTDHNEVVHPHGAIVRCGSCGDSRSMTTREQVAFMLGERVPSLDEPAH